jgi:hypothetical protein
VLVIVSTWPVRRRFLNQSTRQDYNHRLSTQEQYWLQVNKKLKDLPNENEQKLKAEEQLASILAFGHQYKLAHDLYTLVWNERLKHVSTHYEPEVVKILQAMAFLDLDLGDLKACEDCYKTAWDYDKTRLSAGDSRLTRDLNNLAVIHYLLGLTASDKLERQLHLERSNLFLLQALISCRQTASQSNCERQANILDNQFLVLRDTGRLSQAQTAKKAAEKLHLLIPGRFNAP